MRRPLCPAGRLPLCPAGRLQQAGSPVPGLCPRERLSRPFRRPSPGGCARSTHPGCGAACCARPLKPSHCTLAVPCLAVRMRSTHPAASCTACCFVQCDETEHCSVSQSACAARCVRAWPGPSCSCQARIKWATACAARHVLCMLLWPLCPSARRCCSRAAWRSPACMPRAQISEPRTDRPLPANGSPWRAPREVVGRLAGKAVIRLALCRLVARPCRSPRSRKSPERSSLSASRPRTRRTVRPAPVTGPGT